MTRTKQKVIKWTCNLCKDIVTSDSSHGHKMDYCKCKQSAVDHEEYYTRYIGDVTFE